MSGVGIKQKLFGIGGKVKPAPGPNEKTTDSSTHKSDGKKTDAAGKKHNPQKKLYTGAIDLQKQKQEKWSRFRKFFYNKFNKEEKDPNKKRLREELGRTPLETWLTCVFTFVIGTFLFGGGIYLIYNGSDYYVIDFIVVGSIGIVMGICFTVVGLFTILKPIYDKRKEQREAQEKVVELQTQQSTDQTSAYFNSAQAELMTSQIGDRHSNRRPSNVDLYGNDDAENAKSRLSSRESAPLPPPVAVPNHEKDTSERKAVILLGVRESTADDIAVISKAAHAQKVTSDSATASDSANVTITATVELSRESSDVSITDVIERSENRERSIQSSAGSGHVGLPDSPRDSPMPVIVTSTEDGEIKGTESTHSKNKKIDNQVLPGSSVNQEVSNPENTKAILSSSKRRQTSDHASLPGEEEGSDYYSDDSSCEDIRVVPEEPFFYHKPPSSETLISVPVHVDSPARFSESDNVGE
ncbi:uncharacterized protein LOC101847248 [Aplysia californica]|uniref:Uncharacterized protein LOC101847248 n=1 Tax=Aplysia californica TaxID=6500 RepID=A0ABM0JG49_APLCA|nr:uncharacterized protein LOC101847248 [Aplysia californica]